MNSARSGSETVSDDDRGIPSSRGGADWSPSSAQVAADQRATYDRMREQCPVARDESDVWTLFRHADVVRAALDPDAFSSRVSRHLNVPNGMDGEQHARFRALVDRYLAPTRVARFEPRFRRIASDLFSELPRDRTIEAVAEVGARYAVRAQSALLGWPSALEDTLLDWVEENRQATRSGQFVRTATVAARFDEIIGSLIDTRRRSGDDAPEDLTTELVRDSVDGRPLTDEEIVSILRNWTAGDLGSIAACLGVVIHYLASDTPLQDHFRSAGGGAPELDAAIDEILRIDDPFVSNRRVTMSEIGVGDRTIPAGRKVVLNWTAANRDPSVMGDPDAYRPDQNAPHNLVYGIGPHVCAGRGLATLEMRVAIEELLAATTVFGLAPELDPVREVPPVGGFRSVPVLLR
jgi:cytochrome P450